MNKDNIVTSLIRPVLYLSSSEKEDCSGINWKAFIIQYFVFTWLFIEEDAGNGIMACWLSMAMRNATGEVRIWRFGFRNWRDQDHMGKSTALLTMWLAEKKSKRMNVREEQCLECAGGRFLIDFFFWVGGRLIWLGTKQRNCFVLFCVVYRSVTQSATPPCASHSNRMAFRFQR